MSTTTTFTTTVRMILKTAIHTTSTGSIIFGALQQQRVKLTLTSATIPKILVAFTITTMINSSALLITQIGSMIIYIDSDADVLTNFREYANDLNPHSADTGRDIVVLTICCSVANSVFTFKIPNSG